MDILSLLFLFFLVNTFPSSFDLFFNKLLLVLNRLNVLFSISYPCLELNSSLLIHKYYRVSLSFLQSLNILFDSP